MSDERVIVVAIEDLPTAGAVAVEAVRLAIAQEATTLVLGHVLNEHTVLCGILGIAGAYAQLMETEEDAQQMLVAAEEVIRAEFAARDRPVPAIRRAVARGHAGEALSQIARQQKAEWMVVGARRPHLLGRIAHPDVRAHLNDHAGCRLHVAPLQEVTPAPGT